MNEALVEGDRHGQSGVVTQRSGGMNVDAIAGDVGFRVTERASRKRR